MAETKETYITISTERYAELIRAEERTAIVERMIANDNYVCTGDIAIVLGISIPKKGC